MNILRTTIFCNLFIACIALFLAFIIWNICVQTITTEKTIRVPVCFHHISEDNTLLAQDTIYISLQGPQAIMRTLSDSAIALHIDARHCPDDINWISVAESNLSIPHGIHMTHAYPAMLKVTTTPNT